MENIIHFWRHEKRYGNQGPYSENLHVNKSRLLSHPFTPLLKDRISLALHSCFVKSVDSDRKEVCMIVGMFLNCRDSTDG